MALFLDLWRRRNNEIAFRWGVDGVEDEELMRVQAARVRVLRVRVPCADAANVSRAMVPRISLRFPASMHVRSFRRMPDAPGPCDLAKVFQFMYSMLRKMESSSRVLTLLNR